MLRTLSSIARSAMHLVYTPTVLDKQYFLRRFKKIDEVSRWDDHYNPILLETLLSKYRGRENETIQWLDEIALNANLKTPDDIAYREQAIYCIGLLPYPGKDTYLAKYLEDENPFIRKAAIKAIGPESDRLSLMIKHLDDDPMVSSAAAYKLGFIGGKEALQALEAKLCKLEGDNNLRDAINKSIERISEKIFDEILKELKTISTKDIVKQEGLRKDLTRRYIENYSELRIRTILAEIALYEKNISCKLQAMQALKELGDTKGLQALIEILEREEADPSLRW